jgi:Mrp family chromosome partitioning ATPase
MDLIDYLRAFRRRWPVIAVTTVVAMLAAWVTTETFAPVAPTTKPTFVASTLLEADGGAIGSVPGNLSKLAVMATIPQVARQAAEELSITGDPLKLRDLITATADPETGFLTIAASGRDPLEAERTADAFATALINFLHERTEQANETQIVALERLIREARVAGDESAVIIYEQQLASLEAGTTSPSGVTVIHKAIAEEIQPSGFSPPDSRLVRLAIAFAIGLLAGAGLALVLERIDTKVRTSEQATERFGYPVLAEIPSIRKKQRKGVVTADHPTSATADAFRLLGAGVHVAVRPPAEDEEGSERRGRIILVTSSGPAEGKSTVVANLAAVLAEEGKKVIVFSADLRRPMLHAVLGADREPGLVQAAREAAPGIRQYKQWTRLDRVLFVPSGGSTERPGEVLASPSVAALLHEACDAADWVVLDTAPILVAGESAPLIDEADLVLIVARSGMISNPVAERTRETLHRLGADAAWVVLNASRVGRMPSGYRRYHVQVDKDAKARAAMIKGAHRDD